MRRRGEMPTEQPWYAFRRVDGNGDFMITRPTRWNTNRTLRAFTMVELLTVLIIIIIVAAISIPAFSDLFSNNNLVQAENQVSAAMTQASSLALEKHTSVAIIFFEEPGHGGETAYAYEIAAGGQSGGTSSVQTFLADPSLSIQYLPHGTYVATLVGGAGNSGFAMPPQSITAVNNPLRAIVFNASGHVTILNAMVTAAPETLSGYAGFWDSTTVYGPSSPAFVIFQPGNWPAADTSSISSEAAYLAASADVMMVSTYTGNIIQ